MPLQARLLDYDNAQMILIGERTGDITKALEPTQKDEKHHKETPIEEMEKLEHEDGIRIHHLKGKLQLEEIQMPICLTIQRRRSRLRRSRY